MFYIFSKVSKYPFDQVHQTCRYHLLFMDDLEDEESC